MNDELRKNLGPLATLLGTWEGDKGDDTSPNDNRGTERNLYRERLRFESTGRVDNHEQILYGLRYSRIAWRLGEVDHFHEEYGYYLWDSKTKQVMRSLLIPRGMTVLAGGTVEPDATVFSLRADVGSETYGICSNPFLAKEFKTVRFDMAITVHGPDRFSYAEDTQLQMSGRSEVFHHLDKNTLQRVPDSVNP